VSSWRGEWTEDAPAEEYETIFKVSISPVGHATTQEFLPPMATATILAHQKIMRFKKSGHPVSAAPYTFAIVGLGPRGHYALERLLYSLCEADVESGFKITCFEQSQAVGHGPVYTTDQPDCNWINISERLLDLPPRVTASFGQIKVPSFVGYHEWTQSNFDSSLSDRKDTYPPRAKIGRYLEERFHSMVSPLIKAGILEIWNDTAKKISNSGISWQITSESGSVYDVDDILLTIGHQPTAPDEQIATWRKHAQTSENIALFEEPYPVELIRQAAQKKRAVRMAIRGYGLATIDVVRAVALEFGSFETTDQAVGTLRYNSSNDADVLLTPYSLDGLTMGPKPLNASIDVQFTPSREAMMSLSDHLGNRIKQEEATDAGFLTKAMCHIAASVYLKIEHRYEDDGINQSELELVAAKWIDDQSYQHPILLDTTIAPQTTLGSLIAMATGKGAISFDYCIGQVWRHCQPTIYSALSHSALNDNILAEIIFVDEGLKRYSYGPPVASLQQLVALYEAGILNLKMLSDPDILTGDAGWTLTNDKEHFDADIMVNAVLDSPKIKSVTSKILKSLLKDGLIDPVHDELGIATSEDAYIKTKRGRNDLPIAFLGRLAKGTVIGVDAILECFGQRAKTWAHSAAYRAEPKLTVKS